MLLHPLGADRHVWEPIVQRLRGRRELIAVDLPGFGDSPCLDGGVTPTPKALAAAVAAAGGRVISGLQMLLHQAFAQVEQFTGLPAPREAMTCALDGLD